LNERRSLKREDLCGHEDPEMYNEVTLPDDKVALLPKYVSMSREVFVEVNTRFMVTL
jgi:hypothetical protein